MNLVSYNLQQIYYSILDVYFHGRGREAIHTLE